MNNISLLKKIDIEQYRFNFLDGPSLYQSSSAICQSINLMCQVSIHWNCQKLLDGLPKPDMLWQSVEKLRAIPLDEMELKLCWLKWFDFLRNMKMSNHHYFAIFHLKENDFMRENLFLIENTKASLHFFELFPKYPESQKSKSIVPSFLSKYYFIIFLMDNFGAISLEVQREFLFKNCRKEMYWCTGCTCCNVIDRWSSILG